MSRLHVWPLASDREPNSHGMVTAIDVVVYRLTYLEHDETPFSNLSQMFLC